MIDWSKLLKIAVKREEDAPKVINQLLETIPDNMFMRIYRKSIDREEKVLLKFLEEEKAKRGL